MLPPSAITCDPILGCSYLSPAPLSPIMRLWDLGMTPLPCPPAHASRRTSSLSRAGCGQNRLSGHRRDHSPSRLAPCPFGILATSANGRLRILCQSIGSQSVGRLPSNGRRPPQMSLRRGHGCPPRTTEVDETVGSASRGLARHLFHLNCRREIDATGQIIPDARWSVASSDRRHRGGPDRML